MTTVLVVIHLLICFFLIAVVLLQGGKGAELGSTFGGGSSQTLFGGRGAATFMNKMTTVIAIAFMVTSLILTVVSVKKGSVVKSTIIPADERLPAVPGGVKPGTKGVKPAAPQNTAVDKQAEKK
jgi:preprotein translocase subunit SecG